MPHLGATELLIILLIVLVLFGSSRLPSIGRGIGEGLRNLKKGLSEPDRHEPNEGKTS